MKLPDCKHLDEDGAAIAVNPRLPLPVEYSIKLLRPLLLTVGENGQKLGASAP